MLVSIFEFVFFQADKIPLLDLNIVNACAILLLICIVLHLYACV